MIDYWIFEGGKWLAFADGTFVYRVWLNNDGWNWEEALGWEGGYNYDTAEEAKAAAEEHFKKRLQAEEWLEMNDPNLGYTQEELDEILGDILYEEARDEGWLK